MVGVVVSKTAYVEFADQGFWAFDVSLSIMLAETVWVGDGLPKDQRPEWLPDALDKLRVLAVVSDLGFVVELSWPLDGVRLLKSLLMEVSRRLTVRGMLSADEVATWDVLDGDTIGLRNAEVVDLAPVVELTQATIQLLEGTLPQAPSGTCWMYGFEGGRHTIAIRA
jgi:hypothetical protein